MRFYTYSFSLIFTIGLSLQALGANCTSWARSEKIGALPHEVINEASGLIVTDNHLLHINDSGGSAELFWTSKNGQLVATKTLNEEPYYDTEALAHFEENGQHYIIVGDVGDNAEHRGNLRWFLMARVNRASLYVFKASSLEPNAELTFSHRLKLIYPDRPHNSEGIAVHPTTGDLYLLTKESRFKERGHQASHLLKIPKNIWLSGEKDKFEMELVRKIPVHKINTPVASPYDKLTTGMDISPNGDRLLILTYLNAIEVDWAAATNASVELKKGENFRKINTGGKAVIQEEAIGYDKDGSIYFTSELGLGINPNSNEAPILKINCEG